ncbi:MAG: hypothetical protein HDR88_03380 [Bacteroides sp.]|nr:hypothetical protein [Bacteroides sp.]
MKSPVIIRNNIIPFKGYAAINLFGVFFVRKDVSIDPTLLNHELIHTRQMKETFYIGFYILYLLFWFFLLLKYKFNSNVAYWHIPFEIEAYANERNMKYLSQRRLYNWIRYMIIK